MIGNLERRSYEKRRLMRQLFDLVLDSEFLLLQFGYHDVIRVRSIVFGVKFCLKCLVPCTQRLNPLRLTHWQDLLFDFTAVKIEFAL